MAIQQPFLLGLLAEEFLHAGSGQSTGVIDLPVAREGHTGWPYIPDTAVKGALKEWDKEWDNGCKWVESVYGKEDTGAGEAMIGGARLLFLPIRHLEGTYAWVTCPALLERFWRDWDRFFLQEPFAASLFQRGGSLASNGDDKIRTNLVSANTKLHLEDLVFDAEPLDSANLQELSEKIDGLLGGTPAKDRLIKQIAVVTDAIFGEFARWACYRFPKGPYY